MTVESAGTPNKDNERNKMKSYVELAKINVNEHTEKKNGLTYLSWAWAVDQLQRLDDNASWSYGEPAKFGDTLMVFCTVKAFGKERTAQLPVMDYKNRAIPLPDAMAVNTAMQRCLAKAIALHGIGLYIYAGEDLPQTDEAAPASAKAVTADVWDNLTTDEQTWLQDIADSVRRELNMKGGIAALKVLEEQGLGADHKVAIWSRFDSKERAAMKPQTKKAA
jgi:hypothetical protein